MILVVGGAGYIGSHFVNLAAKTGQDRSILVLDNLSKGHRASIPGIPFVQADMRDPASMQRVFRDHPIKQVVHFGALSEVGEGQRNPSAYWHNNVEGTRCLLDAMRFAEVDQIVFSSTAAVYGEPDTVPIPETAPRRPTNVYGQTKLAVEHMQPAWPVRYVALRYFNAAGCSLDGQLGEDHRPESHLIPRAIDAALGRADFRIFGTDYDTPDGTAIRDYIHVDDLATAHLMALDHLANNGESTTYNLGSGQGYSVQEIVTAIQKRQPFDPESAPKREGDPARLIADTTAINAAWGWQPQHDLETMIGTAFTWRQAHPSGYSD